MTEPITKFKAALRVAAIKGRDKAFADIKPQPGLIEVISELKTVMQELRVSIAERGAGEPSASAGGMRLTITERDLQGRVRSFETESLPGQSMRFTITDRSAEGSVKSFDSEVI